MKLYLKIALKRFVVYPLIVGFITFHLLDLMSSFEIGELFREFGPIAIMEESLNISLPFDKVKYFYAYAVGFSYGTMSSLLPIHKLKLGMVGLVLMYLKLIMSMIFLSPIAMIWIPTELILIGTLFVLREIMKKMKENKYRQDPIYT